MPRAATRSVAVSCANTAVVVLILATGFGLPAPVQAQTLFDETFTWAAQANVDSACTTRAYSIQGPGYFRVQFAMDPNRRRDFFNRSDALYTFTSHDGWELTRNVEAVNGQPVPRDAPSGYRLGKPYTSDSEWKIPARPFAGEIQVCTPVNCNLANCSSYAATATLKVTFGAQSSDGGGSGVSAPAAPATGTDAARVLGDWRFDGNGYPGYVSLSLEAGRLVGHVYHDVTKKWEQLTDVRYSPQTGEISFTRPWPGNPEFQKYRGRLVAGAFQGTFTDNNTPGREYPWQARRFLGSIVGEWKLDGNGYAGRLKFEVQADRLEASVYYEVGQRWETLADVRFVPETGAVSFTRPWPGNPVFQRYSGQLEGYAIRGSFTDTNAPGRQFPWTATK